MEHDKISIVIVDDHELTRLGIRKIIEQANDMEVVGEAESGNTGISLVAKLRPKVLLLDIQMPGMPAREVEKKVREEFPEVITLVLTGHDRDAYLSDFIKSGASGYLNKNQVGENLIAAIKKAVSGDILFTSRQLERAQVWDKQVREKWEELTKREKQVINLITEGANNKTISLELTISTKTVEKHLERIYQKLGVTSRTEAALWGKENIRDFPY